MSPSPTCSQQYIVFYLQVRMTYHTVCDLGDVRLTNLGFSILEGDIEICGNNTWGYVCNTTWSEQATSVACGQLGYPAVGKEIKPKCVSWSSCVIICVGA